MLTFTWGEYHSLIKNSDYQFIGDVCIKEKLCKMEIAIEAFLTRMHNTCRIPYDILKYSH